MPLDFFIMTLIALCCAFIGWAVVFLSAKIDGPLGREGGGFLPRSAFDAFHRQHQAQRDLNVSPRQRRFAAEHPFGTIKRMTRRASSRVRYGTPISRPSESERSWHPAPQSLQHK